jgi:hypothetical protein
MIQLITWRQYLIFISSATLLYYAVIVLRYYRSEIKNLFSSKPPTGQNPEGSPVMSEHQFVGEPEFDGQQSLSAEELFFAATDEEEAEPIEATEQVIKQPEVSTAPDETFLLGPVADFLKELKSGFGLLREADGNKEEFLTLLGILSEKHHQVMQSAYRPLLEVFILELATEQLPFELKPEDLEIQSIQQ